MKRMTYFSKFLPHLLIMLGVVLAFSAPARAADRALAFAVPGVIADITVKAGAHVVKGAVLAVLDQRPFSASKKASDARVDAAMVTNDLLARRLKQTEQLFDSLSASVEDVEDAKTAAAVAKSDLETARAHAAQAAWNYERSTLRAPFDGTVASVPGYPGMVIPLNGDAVPVVIIRVP